MTYQFFVVTLHTDKTTIITNKKQEIMIQLTNINEHGLLYICMAIIDMVNHDGRNLQRGQGMNVGGTYLTPETCYWLIRLLQETPDLYGCIRAIDMLSKGTNHPETFKQ